MHKAASWISLALAWSMIAGGTQAAPNPFDEFQRAAQRTCPSHNLHYLMQGDWNEILLDRKGIIFPRPIDSKLSASSRRFAQTLHCTRYPVIDCEASAQFYAIQSRGLMREAVRQICSHWRCADEATCTYEPWAGRSAREIR
jgi:hypothetical protein